MDKTDRLKRARAAKGPKRKLRKVKKPTGRTFTLRTQSYITDETGKFLRLV